MPRRRRSDARRPGGDEGCRRRGRAVREAAPAMSAFVGVRRPARLRLIWSAVSAEVGAADAADVIASQARGLAMMNARWAAMIGVMAAGVAAAVPACSGDNGTGGGPGAGGSGGQ